MWFSTYFDRCRCMTCFRGFRGGNGQVASGAIVSIRSGLNADVLEVTGGEGRNLGAKV